MSNAEQFFGGRGAPRPTGTLNGTSAFRQVISASGSALASYTPVKVVASGACTANTLKTILSLSGSGVLSFLAVESANTTSRTHRIKVTLDGIVIFDATTAAVTSVALINAVIGSLSNVVASTSSSVEFEPLAFNTSLLVEYADSLSETDGAYIGYRYFPA